MQNVLLKHFPHLNNTQLEQFAILEKKFPNWNMKINCISRKDIDNLFVNHILHSLSIAVKFKFDKNQYVADVGTGGGFPGIPLAIMFPETKFDLIDSIAKKIFVVQELKKELKLYNVNALNIRVETLKPKYDFVISRAVTALPNFYKLVKNVILKDSLHKKQGIIYLKGGDFEQELSIFKDYQIFNISEFMNYQQFETKKIIYIPVNKKNE